MALRDEEIDKIVRETIPDILERLEALENACCCEEATAEVVEEGGAIRYGGVEG